MWAVSQDYIMREDLAMESSLSIVVKKIKVSQKNFQKETRSELLKHFRRQGRGVEKSAVI